MASAVAPAVAWSVPRIIRNVFSSPKHAISSVNHDDATPFLLDLIEGGGGHYYSPRELLSRFDRSSVLTVKRSSRRFFMYEERRRDVDDDVSPSTVDVSPNELAGLLHRSSSSSSSSSSGDGDCSRHHYYWTSPVSASAPRLAVEFERHVARLHDHADLPLLDPRGPSLWMGTSGSGTQCHYDVANNAILQLYGTKRVRAYGPRTGVERLHVYPDAHPRARKSQIDFDVDVDDASRTRYPHYYASTTTTSTTTTTMIPRPTLDVVLRPGDALYVPAFWFHHVENGRIPGNVPRDDDDENDLVDGPSVSLNCFALSDPMTTARRIFASASRPFGSSAGEQRASAGALLGALGTSLVRELNVVDIGMERDFVRRRLLEARYVPLELLEGGRTTTGESGKERKDSGDDDLTSEQRRAIESCIERIMPDFRHLLRGGGAEDAATRGGRGGEGREDGDDDDGVGIALLVALHLLELWAVEMVGVERVAEVWDDALS